MKNIFFISDHHLGHENILNFTNNDGTKVRDFNSVEDMHNFIIQQHNKVVGVNDTVYFLGDVAIKKHALSIINELNGKKRLILGNHDIFNERKSIKTPAGVIYYNEYDQYVGEILAYKVCPDVFVCSPTPLSVKSITERFCFNVHGHLHNNIVKTEEGFEDPRYFNVSCERLNFKPIEFTEVKKLLNSQFRSIEFQRNYK